MDIHHIMMVANFQLLVQKRSGRKERCHFSYLLTEMA